MAWGVGAAVLLVPAWVRERNPQSCARAGRMAAHVALQTKAPGNDSCRTFACRYTDVAKTAYAVKQRTGQVGLRSSLAAAARQASAAAAGKPSGSSAAGGTSTGPGAGAAAASGAAGAGSGGSGRGGGGGGSGGNLEDVAQEVYRLVLFCVFFGEVWVLGHLPHVGECTAEHV